jgi:hypothetical protein
MQAVKKRVKTNVPISLFPIHSAVFSSTEIAPMTTKQIASVNTHIRATIAVRFFNYASFNEQTTYDSP